METALREDAATAPGAPDGEGRVAFLQAALDAAESAVLGSLSAVARIPAAAALIGEAEPRILRGAWLTEIVLGEEVRVEIGLAVADRDDGEEPRADSLAMHCRVLARDAGPGGEAEWALANSHRPASDEVPGGLRVGSPEEAADAVVREVAHGLATAAACVPRLRPAVLAAAGLSEDDLGAAPR